MSVFHFLAPATTYRAPGGRGYTSAAMPSAFGAPPQKTPTSTYAPPQPRYDAPPRQRADWAAPLPPPPAQPAEITMRGTSGECECGAHVDFSSQNHILLKLTVFIHNRACDHQFESRNCILTTIKFLDYDARDMGSVFSPLKSYISQTEILYTLWRFTIANFNKVILPLLVNIKLLRGRLTTAL